MDTFNSILKYLRKREGLTQSEFSEKIGVSKSAISMYENGKREPDFNTLEVIADYFNVDMNFLLGKPDTSTDWTAPPELTAKDKKDIAKDLEEYRKHLSSAEGLMFDGEPATEEAVQSIIDSLEVGIEIAKKRNKEKYTPKKYRK